MTARPSGNPMHDLLRQELGIDAFALDGNGAELPESWQDRGRQLADPAARSADGGPSVKGSILSFGSGEDVVYAPEGDAWRVMQDPARRRAMAAP